jgi:hypothetical protein
MDTILDVVYTKVAEKWVVITVETNIAFFFTLQQDIQLNGYSIFFSFLLYYSCYFFAKRDLISL